MPEITVFKQVSDGEEAEFTVKVKNTDNLKVVATNSEGSIMQQKDVGTVEPPVDNLSLSLTVLTLIMQMDGLDSVSGNFATGEGTQVEDADGKGVSIDRNSTGLIFSGLTHTDYTYKIKCKMKGTIDNIRSLIMKRETWSDNKSLLYLFNFDGNKSFWDNTQTSNRIDSGYVPVEDKLMDIHIARNLGMWINGIKVADPGNIKDVINTFDSQIGGDKDNTNRGLGGIIYSIEVYDKSISV